MTNNGAPPPGPSEDQEAMNLFVAHQVEAIAAQLVLHMPELAKDVEKLGAFCFERLSEQAGLLEYMQDALTPERIAEKPWWGYRAMSKTGEIRVKCPKRMGEVVKDPNGHLHLFNFASLLGLLLSPVTRGVLGVCGVRLDFFQCDAEAPKPKILS
ncbi:MAG: hypothetical protein KC492_23940 [Myxococcales bacterium]|nr:hypothetical protein [Myxococcales bacterium]